MCAHCLADVLLLLVVILHRLSQYGGPLLQQGWLTPVVLFLAATMLLLLLLLLVCLDLHLGGGGLLLQLKLRLLQLRLAINRAT
jgi:hypothetical protein